jgi:hypothetical protein
MVLEAAADFLIDLSLRRATWAKLSGWRSPWSSAGLLQGWNKIGPGKIVSLEEQGLSGCFREGVGEAVAEIQLRGVAGPTCPRSSR